MVAWRGFGCRVSRRVPGITAPTGRTATCGTAACRTTGGASGRTGARNRQSCGNQVQAVMARDILIVDDEADIRNLIAGILQDEGYETRMAGDSDGALREIEARRPNLVIIDLRSAEHTSELQSLMR